MSGGLGLPGSEPPLGVCLAGLGWSWRRWPHGPLAFVLSFVICVGIPVEAVWLVQLFVFDTVLSLPTAAAIALAVGLPTFLIFNLRAVRRGLCGSVVANGPLARGAAVVREPLPEDAPVLAAAFDDLKRAPLSMASVDFVRRMIVDELSARRHLAAWTGKSTICDEAGQVVAVVSSVPTRAAGAWVLGWTPSRLDAPITTIVEGLEAIAEVLRAQGVQRAYLGALDEPDVAIIEAMGNAPVEEAPRIRVRALLVSDRPVDWYVLDLRAVRAST